jgi:muramoyltetrapeptide carboxypeptidase
VHSIRLLRPTALQEGDCIGLAAPASAVNREALLEGVKVLQTLGFRVQYTPRVFDKQRYLAGTDTDRAVELQALFTNPDVKAIFCCRGGYGSQRLIPYLEPALITRHPKIFLGYSDLTSLLLYFQHCGLITFHGPVVAGDLRHDSDPAILQQLKGVLMGDAQAMQPPAQHTTALTVLRPGDAQGRLLGGCLSLVVCTIGTFFQPDTRDTILFLEDRGERLYAIDRMLTYLKLAGVFEGVRGLVFGSLDLVAADCDRPYGMTDVILDVLGDLDIPILANFPAGHCSQPLTLPFGVQAAICGSRLLLCESPVVTI